jgi:hypothetical protein
MLKVRLAEEASAVAQRAVSAVLDPSADPIAAGRLGLALIDACDPLVTASVTVDLPSDPAALDKLSLSELLRLAEVHQIPVPSRDASADVPALDASTA